MVNFFFSPRLELGLRQTPQLVFWAWHGLRQFTVFFFNIFVCTIEKNIKDRWDRILQIDTQSSLWLSLLDYTRTLEVFLLSSFHLISFADQFNSSSVSSAHLILCCFRLMPIVQLLRWLKIQAEMSGPKRQSHSGPYSKLSSPLHSDDIGDVGLRRRLLNITPLRDNKKAECCVERSTDIFL